MASMRGLKAANSHYLYIFTPYCTDPTMVRIPFILLVLISLPAIVFAQTFTSSQAGPWDVAATWGGAGVPTSANSTAIIVNHVVNVPNGFTVAIDQTTVNGTLQIDNGGTVNVVDGTGNDLTIGGVGVLDVTGTISKANLSVILGTTAANTNFRSGSFYRHLYTTGEGTIPLATWNSNSTLEIAAYTSGKTLVSTTWSQAFGNVIYNCPAQIAFISFNGLLNNIQGNLVIQNSNSTPIQLIGNQATIVTIGGNLSVLGSSRFNVTSIGNPTLNIGGDFIFASTNVNGSYICSFGSATLNISGDFLMNAPGGILYAGAGDPSTGTATLNLAGDFSIQEGTFRENGNSSQAVLNFTNSSAHTFLNTGTIFGTVDYFVSASDTLVVTDPSYLGGINGTGVTSDFVLNGKLVVQSTDVLGALRSGTQGNIRTPVATRQYNPGSTIIYGSTTGAQFIGDGHPSSPGINLVIDNPSGVSYASNVFSLTVTGDLTLATGDISVATTSSLRTLTLSGNIFPGSGLLSFSGPSSDITINGSGLTASIAFNPAAQNVRNFTLNRATGASLVSPVTINNTGTLILTAGDLVFGGQTLTVNGNTSSTGGSLSSNGTSTLVIGGNGAFGVLVPFSPSGNTLGTLTMNRASGGTATINSAIIISSTLNLTLGNLTNTSGLTMGNGSTIIRTSVSSLLGNRPSNAPGDSYSVTYSGSTTTTGLELPLASDVDDLGDLTINGGPITLNQSIIINGSFNLNASSIALGANIITMEGTNWNDNGGSPSWGTNPVIFNGASTSVGGTGTPIFNNIQVNTGASVLFTRNSVLAGSMVVANGATVTFPSTTLGISRDITIDAGASINPNNGTVILAGNVVQSVSANGATFYNLTVNKPSGLDVSLLSALNISGILNVLSANSDLATNGFLTLLSTSDGNSGNGSITALLNNATVSGNVTVQRFQSAEGPVNRYISSPITNARVMDLQDDFPITGPFTGTDYPCAGCLNNGFSFKYYNESAVGAFNKGYVGYPPTGSDNTLPLVVGRGYLAYMWQGASQITWDLTGPINKGSVPLPVTFTNTGDPNADGWNLVGNPFPSSIDWDTGAGWTKTNIAGTIYVWDDVASVFRTWNGSSGDLNNGVIATGQSFWVYTPGSPTLIVNELAKTSTTGTYYRVGRKSLETMKISLSQGTRTDNSFLILNEEATPAYDIEFDARKLEGDNLAVSIADNEGSRWALYAVNSLAEDAIVPLEVLTEEGKSYELGTESQHGFSLEGWKLYDQVTEEYIVLSSKKSLTFVGGPTDRNRFYLTRGEVEAGQKTSQLSVYPNPASTFVQVSWEGEGAAQLMLVNSLGMQMLPAQPINSGEKTELNIGDLKSGIYIIRVVAAGSTVTHKLIKK